MSCISTQHGAMSRCFALWTLHTIVLYCACWNWSKSFFWTTELFRTFTYLLYLFYFTSWSSRSSKHFLSLTWTPRVLARFLYCPAIYLNRLLSVPLRLNLPSAGPDLFLNTSAAFFKPKQSCLQKHKLSHLEGSDSSESGSRGTGCSVFHASRYLCASCIHGPWKRGSARLPLFP